MIDDFKPPIKGRTTEELLQIVGSPDAWDEKAVLLAANELTIRKIPFIKIETAKYLSLKRKRIKKRIKANEGYTILDFIFNPVHSFMEVFLVWGLEKDGYIKKAKQQKKIRIGIIMFLLLSYIIYVLYNSIYYGTGI